MFFYHNKAYYNLFLDIKHIFAQGQIKCSHSIPNCLSFK